MALSNHACKRKSVQRTTTGCFHGIRLRLSQAVLCCSLAYFRYQIVIEDIKSRRNVRLDPESTDRFCIAFPLAGYGEALRNRLTLNRQ